MKPSDISYHNPKYQSGEPSGEYCRKPKPLGCLCNLLTINALKNISKDGKFGSLVATYAHVKLICLVGFQV